MRDFLRNNPNLYAVRDFLRKHKHLSAGIALLFIIILFSGLSKTPQQRPGPFIIPPPVRIPIPVIPELAQKYQEEPTISVYMHDTGAVRWMKMDDYLAGVLAAEMEPSWPVEALAAQAIVARTMTLRFIEEKTGAYQFHRTDTCTAPWHVQAYAANKVNDNIRKAVEMTRGKVITYQGQLIYAMYSSWSGGHTATPAEGFVDFLSNGEKTPYLASVPDPWDAGVPANLKEWTVSIPKSELQNAAGGGTGPFDSVTIAEAGPSGRIISAKIGSKVVPGPNLRTSLGTSRLRSTLITNISVVGNSVRFTGRGWGHGVGMSQWGAFGQANAGRSHADIIHHYFQEVDISSLWS